MEIGTHPVGQGTYSFIFLELLRIQIQSFWFVQCKLSNFASIPVPIITQTLRIENVDLFPYIIDQFAFRNSSKKQKKLSFLAYRIGPMHIQMSPYKLFYFCMYLLEIFGWLNVVRKMLMLISRFVTNETIMCKSLSFFPLPPSSTFLLARLLTRFRLMFEIMVGHLKWFVVSGVQKLIAILSLLIAYKFCPGHGKVSPLWILVLA